MTKSCPRKITIHAPRQAARNHPYHCRGQQGNKNAVKKNLSLPPHSHTQPQTNTQPNMRVNA